MEVSKLVKSTDVKLAQFINIISVKVLLTVFAVPVLNDVKFVQPSNPAYSISQPTSPKSTTSSTSAALAASLANRMFGNVPSIVIVCCPAVANE